MKTVTVELKGTGTQVEVSVPCDFATRENSMVSLDSYNKFSNLVEQLANTTFEDMYQLRGEERMNRRVEFVKSSFELLTENMCNVLTLKEVYQIVEMFF